MVPRLIAALAEPPARLGDLLRRHAAASPDRDFLIERRPSRDLVRDGFDPRALGLFDGPIHGDHTTAAPTRIVLFVNNLLADFPEDPELSDQIDSWRDVHDEIVAADDQLRMYVTMLEAEFDRRSEAAIPSADDLGDEFETFLKDLRDD